MERVAPRRQSVSDPRFSFRARTARLSARRTTAGARIIWVCIQRQNLVAAAPLYLKGNSHGEYVFDWSWASAYERAGLDYYPKLLVRHALLAGHRRTPAGRHAARMRRRCARSLLAAIVQEIEARGLVVGASQFRRCDADADAFERSGLAARASTGSSTGRNRDASGWRDFDEFLAALNHKKRKNIRHERAQVARAGVACEMRHGDEMSDDELARDARLYLRTFDEKGNHPALTAGVLPPSRRCDAATGARRAVQTRRRDSSPMALLLRSVDTLYGRYWGCQENIPGLHFEACYYQGIEYCLRHGLSASNPARRASTSSRADSCRR